MPQFTNASVHEQFGSETEMFSKTLLRFSDSVSGNEHDRGHFSSWNMNAAIFPKIAEGMKLVN